MGTPSAAVAVVGLAGRFPGAASVPELWRNVLAGQESLTRFDRAELAAAGVDPAEYERPEYVPVRGVLDGVDRFDAELFGYPPREAELMDPQQRILLECGWHALEDAGYAGRPGRVGVFAGTTVSSYLLRYLLARRDLERTLGMLPILLGNDKDHVATRLAYKMGLTGPAVTVQTGCSTSLVAVHFAVQSLLRGESDLALAGGASVQLPQESGYLYSPHGITSPDGHCRAFDAQARGTVAGNGAALVVLKRADEALRDNDHVYALIRGSAINNDGADKVGYTAPSVSGQADVVRAALRAAGVRADEIGYVETHGTGTELGDGIEIAALTDAFRESTNRSGYCAIGSLKPNIGHLDAAAGVAGLVKAVLALAHATLPPSINCTEPNPELGLPDTPFYVNTRSRPWPAGAAPRRAGVSSFGMGGTNAHVVLEEAPPAPPRQPATGRPVLVVQAGRSRQAVETLGDRLTAHLTAEPGIDLADVAYTLQVGRAALPWRRAVTVAGPDELRARLPRVPVREAPRSATVAFLFPGQGAQYAGMTAGLYHDHAEFRAAFDECLGLAERGLAERLATLLCTADPTPADDAALTDTRLAQPALFAVEYALARTLMTWGIRPKMLLGHSIGEYAAACLAGAMTAAEAMELVVARGELMARAPGGAMLAVLADEETVRAQLGPELSLAAVNAPDAVVVAGAAAVVNAAAARFTATGLRNRLLGVSHAFHSARMDPVLDEFRTRASAVTFRRLRTTVLSNVTGEPVPRAGGYSADYWTRHLREPVRFAAGLAHVLSAPNPLLVEVGPGSILTSLAQRSPLPPGTLAVTTMPGSPGTAEEGRRTLLDAVGAAWTVGAPVDWAAVNQDRPGRRVPLPGYPFARSRHWLGGVAPPTADPPGGDAPPTRAEPVTTGLPATTGPERPTVLDEPEIRRQLAEIWQRLLGVDDLSPEADFFALGGHSLLAVPLLAGVLETFGVAVSLQEATATPTLGGQAALVLSRLAGESDD